MNRRVTSLLLFYTLLGSVMTNAQEALSHRATLVAKKTSSTVAIKNRLKSQKSGSLDLPFFDDFSQNIPGYPDQTRWADSLAYINNSYPVNPPSVGVATLDAVDATGTLYSQASSSPFLADALTSQPIQLSYSPSDSIYLSFFYQPQGLGDMPEPKDSLTLDFFAPLSETWHRIWAVPGDSLRAFRPVILPVNDTIYLHDGFRFRFRNYASLSDYTADPGKIDNDDHWHIDYVYLDKNRKMADTIPDDVAFSTLPKSILKSYESIPWSHYQIASNREITPTDTFTYQNLYSIVRKVDRHFSIEGLNLSYSYLFDPTSENVPAFSEQKYVADIDKIPYTAADSADFLIRCWLTTDTVSARKMYRANDTVSYIQKFSNYYAYDDGTAEYGYGLSGQGAQGAELAYRFVLFQQDTLRAVKMYFNRSLDDVNQVDFDLAVWNNANGKPGDIIYQQSNSSITPYFDNLNQFHTYLLDTPVALPDTFYVGWIQNYITFLNVGFDINRVHNDQIFFNISGSWEKSRFKGSLMIRPVVGKALSTGIKNTTVSAGSEWQVFPNPASTIVHFGWTGDIPLQVRRIMLIRLDGSTVWQDTQLPDELDVSSLQKGIYLLVMTTAQQTYTRKLVIIK